MFARVINLVTHGDVGDDKYMKFEVDTLKKNKIS